MIEFILKDISDVYIRENFKRLSGFLKDLAILKPDFKFFEITFTDGTTNTRYLHRLGYRPKDIIVLSTTNSENVVFNYDLFDKDYLDMSASGACTVRFYAGTHRENS